ncbi:MAG: radical SAM family heme chaperone HemW [Myxococcota bacterium]
MLFYDEQDVVGIYVHIPYCPSICPYCDFNVHLSQDPPWHDLTQALRRELLTRSVSFTHATVETTVETIYFGGGTPSLAPPCLIEEIIATVRDTWKKISQPEVTLEIEPATVSHESLADFRQAGINRVSLGWQSTHNRLLRVLGRGHDAESAGRCFELCRNANFDSVSVDLIFAVPGQTLNDLEADLISLCALRPDHISLYALTYHAGTPMARRQERGSIVPIAEDVEATMMEMIHLYLSEAGYEHYEVSNYAQPGHRSQHNQLYWHGGRYLGLGPGAHSFSHREWLRGWRWEDRRRPAEYLQYWSGVDRESGLPTANDGSVEWLEELTAEQLHSERIMCAMRTIDGIVLSPMEYKRLQERAGPAIREAQARGWLRCEGGHMAPTPLGLRFADSLAAMLC